MQFKNSNCMNNFSNVFIFIYIITTSVLFTHTSYIYHKYHFITAAVEARERVNSKVGVI